MLIQRHDYHHHRHHNNHNSVMDDGDEEERNSLLHDSDEMRPRTTTTKQPTTLRIWTVALLVFFTVSGGPMGSEDAVGAVGPKFALLMYLVFPWIYALPVALITGELSGQYPHDASFTLWVAEAFGPFWAFLEGFWGLVAGMTNSAMYMIMIVQIFERIVQSNLSIGTRWLLGASFAAFSTIPNFLGIRVVGASLLGLFIIVMGPYVILTMMAIPYVNLATWESGSSGGSSSSSSGDDQLPVLSSLDTTTTTGHALSGWTLMMSTAFWNFGGFDSASTYAGEVHDPARTYPIALLVSLALITFGLTIPLLAVTLASGSFPQAPPYRDWEDGTYVDFGFQIGGLGLQFLIGLSGFAAQLAMFTTEVFVDSHLLFGMAQQHLVPRMFLERDAKTGSPIVAVACMFVSVLIGFSFLDRYTLLVMNNTFAGASVLLEVAAAVKLRGSGAGTIAAPDDAFRAPCRNKVTLALSLLPAVLISLYVITPAVLSSPPRTVLATLVVAVGGVMLAGIAVKISAGSSGGTD